MFVDLLDILFKGDMTRTAVVHRLSLEQVTGPTTCKSDRLIFFASLAPSCTQGWHVRRVHSLYAGGLWRIVILLFGRHRIWAPQYQRFPSSFETIEMGYSPHVMLDPLYCEPPPPCASNHLEHVWWKTGVWVGLVSRLRSGLRKLPKHDSSERSFL